MSCTPRSTRRPGLLVYSQPGGMPSAMLENLITQVKALDMNAVRATPPPRRAGDDTGPHAGLKEWP